MAKSIALLVVLLELGCGTQVPSVECMRDADCSAGSCVGGKCIAPPAPTLDVTPSELVVSAGGAAVALTSNVRNSAAVVQWELQGAGELSASSGSSVSYTPPATDAVSAVMAAKVVASLDGTTVRATVSITINPVPVVSLTVTPAAAVLNAGDAALQLTAVPVNSSASITWSLAGPGSLTASTGLTTAYVPPAATALQAEEVATVTATLGVGLAAANSLVTLRPVPGSLDVQLSGLPAGASPSVAVSGPNGFMQVLTASRRLDGLAAGMYTLAPEAIRTGSPVEALWTAPSAMVAVSNGSVASADVQWSKRAGTGVLWAVSMAGSKVLGFTSAQFAGAPGPAAIGLGTSSLQGPSGIAFDSDGSLWIANWGGPVAKFSAASLAASGTPTPDVVLQLPNAGSVRNIAFDSDGTLWLSADGSRALNGIPRAQQAASGPTSPLVLLGNPGWQFEGMALDKFGQLWVSEITGGRLVAFSRAALQVGGAQTPAVVVEGAATQLHIPVGLAFDGTGALWVSNYGSNFVLKFAAASLLSSGAPAPVVTLNLGASVYPFDAVPDKDGNLFVTDGTSLRLFASSAVVSSGSPSPVWTQAVDAQTFDLALNLPDARSPIVQ